MRSSISDQNSRLALRRTFLFLLFLVVIVRVVVPPGYMPAPVHSGSSVSLFVLCGGDRQSAQLLDAWQSEHHHHSMEQSGDDHSHSHGFELCDFDALSMALAAPSADLHPDVLGGSALPEAVAFLAVARRQLLNNHPARAPPTGFFSRVQAI